MTNDRKQRLLEKLASRGKVVGTVLRGPAGESAEQYLTRKAAEMSAKTLKDRMKGSVYIPGMTIPGRGYQFPILGRREAKRLGLARNRTTGDIR
tara:strand:+ start:133 stop:414 length:282 start_codon:yes stop_codon:yes gene_type:complete